MEAITDPGLLLKITPPKLRKSLLVRDRLRRLGAADDDTTVILVEAPAGYGKTSLIAQWRLDWLQSGAAVGWLNLVAGDSPITLVSGIALGLRRSLGRANFGADAVQAVRRGAGTVAALTSLLAEILEASHPMVIAFDNGEHLGDAEAVDVLEYLLHNLPPNLRVVIGTRPPVRAEVLDLLGQGLLRRVTAADLCFDLPEAIQLLTSRSGGRIDTDLCARLHDVTGGWPLGLQLAAAALDRSADPRSTIEEFSRSRDDATQHLFESLVAALPSGLGDFITRCSLLSVLHPSLCEAVTGKDDAGLALQRLVFETPLVSATEGGEWLRLHALAREYLRVRAEKMLSDDERREIHVRAWHWLANHGAAARAAQHALAAGSEREALGLISASLREEFGRGHHGTVIEWLARLPSAAIDGDIEVRIVELWVHVLSYRLGDAQRCASVLLQDPAADDTVKAEVTVALATAFAGADRYDETRDRLDSPWIALCDSRSQPPLTNLRAVIAVYAGATEAARRMIVPRSGEPVTAIVGVWRDYITTWTYLWEGRPALADQVARPQQARWEIQVSRRESSMALMGGALAAACWQQDLRRDAAALLADRMDVLERGGHADGLAFAYVTAARMAVAAGDDRHAFKYLEMLAAHGESRGIARLVFTSLAERVRLHCAGRRPVQASALMSELTARVECSAVSELLLPLVRLEVIMAQAQVAIANGDLAEAEARLMQAGELTARLNRGYEAVQVLTLRALLADRGGESPDSLLTEALSRAQSGGLVRVFADTLPEVVELVRRRVQEAPARILTRAFIDRVLAAAEATPTGDQQPAQSGRSALLTPKEGQVLQLLAGGLQNKQIATELGLSSDTVKWHVKKLLAKLNAGNRDHAVDRARMLGLLR